MAYSVSRLEGSDEFKILNSLVSQPDVSVPNAIESILGLNISSTPDGEYTPGWHCEQLFESVIDIASRTPIPQQLKLVEFLIQLQQTTFLNLDTSTPLECDGQKLYTDLPRIGMSFREEWNFDPQNANATPEEKTSWENKSAFLAQVTALSPVDDPSEIKSRLNFSIFALWAMREAFEKASAPSTPTDTALRAACLWIIYAGDTLLRNVENELVLQDNIGLPGNCYKRKGWRGFNSERLEVWKNGLRAAQKRYEGETRSMVDQALEKFHG
ncbi:hypothetical protein F4805DRAFT_461798 [Annulohypoxylon moriforme]|nr:hypothetical protein F4805DRAFT_461798 [Annulohypoxylon moriforme]